MELVKKIVTSASLFEILVAAPQNFHTVYTLYMVQIKSYFVFFFNENGNAKIIVIAITICLKLEYIDHLSMNKSFQVSESHVTLG